jgi:hypothetical protein
MTRPIVRRLALVVNERVVDEWRDGCSRARREGDTPGLE